MTDERPDGVGFFRGLLAVVRGFVHAVGTVVGWLGRAVSALTRRSHGDAGD